MMAAPTIRSFSSLLLSILAFAILSLKGSRAQLTLPVLAPSNDFDAIDDTYATGPGLDGKL